jgi:hypothetical protein
MVMYYVIHFQQLIQKPPFPVETLRRKFDGRYDVTLTVFFIGLHRDSHNESDDLLVLYFHAPTAATISAAPPVVTNEPLT